MCSHGPRTQFCGRDEAAVCGNAGRHPAGQGTQASPSPWYNRKNSVTVCMQPVLLQQFLQGCPGVTSKQHQRLGNGMQVQLMALDGSTPADIWCASEELIRGLLDVLASHAPGSGGIFWHITILLRTSSLTADKLTPSMAAIKALSSIMPAMQAPARM